MRLLDVLLCHAPVDSQAAIDLASRLERNAEARVRLLATEDTNIAEAWDEGESADAIILLMAPEAVPQRPTRAVWQSLLDHVESRNDPQAGILLMRECAFPKLLERAPCFRRSLEIADLRALDQWLVSLRAPVHTFAAAPAPASGNGELDHLLTLLVDGSGIHEIGGDTATDLALAFARHAADHFLDVIWVECGQRDPACLAGELAARLGAKLDGSLDEAWSLIGSLLRERRVLVVLDDLRFPVPPLGSPAGRGSVLITRPQELQPATTDEPLWHAMAACRTQGFALTFVARLARLSEAEALQGLRQLDCVVAMDAGERRFRRTAAAGTAGKDMQGRHARLLSEIFLDRGNSLCDECVTELDAAVDWAIAEDWALAVRLVMRANLFFQDRGRRFEAVYYLRRLAVAAADAGDSGTELHCRKELSWLTDGEGEVHQIWAPGEQGSLF